MKFISYSHKDKHSIGVLINEKDKFIDIYDCSDGKLPDNMLLYLQDFEDNNILLKQILLKSDNKVKDIKSVKLNAPLPNPNSFIGLAPKRLNSRLRSGEGGFEPSFV